MTKRNFLLISLDSVRADVGNNGSFPAIAQIQRAGVSFRNVISSAPLTPVSHSSVLTGLQPYHHGVRHLFKEKLNRFVSTLPQYLKADGYHCSAIVSCPGLNHWYGLDKGFDQYDDEIPLLADGRNPLEVVDVKLRGTALKRAPYVVKKTIENIDKTREPFFVFTHFFDAHWPYDAPENFGGGNSYEEEIAYTDHYLQQLLAHLKSTGKLDRTDIVLFSDHGEDLEGWYPNDKGGVKLGNPDEAGHGCLLYEQTQKVLLTFLFPESPFQPSIYLDHQVRLVDIMPTVLALKEIPFAPTAFDGVSLIDVLQSLLNDSISK